MISTCNQFSIHSSTNDIRRFLRITVGLLTPLLLLAPAVGNAEEVCCPCYAPGDALNKTCLQVDSMLLGSTTDCSELPQKANLDEGWRCDARALTESECKRTDQNGLCAAGPMSPEDLRSVRKGETITEKSTKEKPEEKPLPFELNISIPGFVASAVSPSLFADYLTTLIRYAISIVAIVSTIAFIYGAFQYLLGSAIPSVSRGKQVMIDAVIGMLLVTSSALILRTLNPNLMLLNLLQPEGVSTQVYEIAAAPVQGTGAAGPPPEGVVEKIIEGAKKAKVDPCILLAICEHETGLRPLWNGQLSGTPKERAICFGTCQVDVRFLHDNNPIVKRTRELYPNFPPASDKAKQFIRDQEEKLKRADWMLTNIEGSAFIAGSILRSNIAMNGGNELVAVAAYGAGSKSLSRWRKANNCTAEPGLKIKGATMETLNRSCIPHSVGIVIGGNESTACKEDNYNCKNPKPNKKAELVGTCESTGKQCYAMLTDQFVKYVMRAYPKMERTYQCGSR